MTDPDVPSIAYDLVTTSPDGVDVDLLFVPVFDRRVQLDDVAGLDEATGGELARALQRGEFPANAYDVFVTPVVKSWKARRVAFVGAGNLADASAERLWRVGATCSFAARARGARQAAVLLRAGPDVNRFATALADGLQAAQFDDGAYKRRASEEPAALARVTIIAPGADEAALARAVHRGRVIGESVNIARALANEPANVLTPREFAARVATIGAKAGLHVEVLDEHHILEHGMRLLLGVAQGSAEPPRLILLRHDPPGAPASPVIGLIGKGVTFDSGGISIKPAEGMDRMKGDMAGGAAVAAAMRAIAKLESPFRVIAVIPTTENMPGGKATKPGDVIRGANGTSVEIVNTDAEGRLILADALWFARQQGATHLVDVATLTGAVVIALGKHVSGLFGRPDTWVSAVRDAAERAGERVWPMPIYDEAREQLRSEIADLVNSAGRPGGAVTAAAFLSEFAGDGAWAHLDIAGTSWSEAKTPHQPKGATGAAVRVLTEIGLSGGRPDQGRAD